MKLQVLVFTEDFFTGKLFPVCQSAPVRSGPVYYNPVGIFFIAYDSLFCPIFIPE